MKLFQAPMKVQIEITDRHHMLSTLDADYDKIVQSGRIGDEEEETRAARIRVRMEIIRNSFPKLEETAAAFVQQIDEAHRRLARVMSIAQSAVREKLTEHAAGVITPLFQGGGQDTADLIKKMGAGLAWEMPAWNAFSINTSRYSVSAREGAEVEAAKTMIEEFEAFTANLKRFASMLGSVPLPGVRRRNVRPVRAEHPRRCRSRRRGFRVRDVR